jgi:hypothetical protein
MAIEIIVNLKPYGLDEPETIASLKIGNRSASDEICDYDYCFGAPDEEKRIVYQSWFLLRGHRRSDGIWVLVQRILQQHLDGREELSDYTGM